MQSLPIWIPLQDKFEMDICNETNIKNNKRKHVIAQIYKKYYKKKPLIYNSIPKKIIVGFDIPNNDDINNYIMVPRNCEISELSIILSYQL